jgi:hypothetical protein
MGRFGTASTQEEAMESDGPEAGPAAPQTLPLTERVLRWLGPPRSLWVMLWALVPLISPFVFATAIRLAGHEFGDAEFGNLFATQAVVAYACLVFLVGGRLLGRQATTLRQDLARLAPGAAASDLFGRIGDTAGPLVLTAIGAAILSTNGWLRYGPIPPLAALPPLLVYLVPIATFVWVYLTILVDLDRLGRQQLALEAFPEDRTLGLEEVGSLASAGLGLVLAAAVPVLLAGSDEPVTLGISLAIVVATVAVFVLSMWRLHRQMAAAKRRHVAVARRLYADAFAPLRDHPDIETLAARSGVLQAAQSLDERAESLQTWPVAEETMRFLAVIVTGVLTSLIVRGLFAAIGF